MENYYEFKRFRKVTNHKALWCNKPICLFNYRGKYELRPLLGQNSQICDSLKILMLLTIFSMIIYLKIVPAFP